MQETVTEVPNNLQVRNASLHDQSTPDKPTPLRLSIIIPCYNEASTIAVLLEKVISVKLTPSIKKEVIIVDDCSIDASGQIIREFIRKNPAATIHYIPHATNQGKGAAVHSGLEIATGDYVLIQDADLEYDPAEYALLLEPILRGYADVVYGSRFMGGNPHRVLFFWHTWGNKMLTFINNVLTNMNLTDAHTCYKLIKTNIIRNIRLLEKGFAFDSELNAKIARLSGVRIYEVGISYYGRTFSEGKKIRFRDALRSVYCLVKYTFLPSSHKSPKRSIPVPASNA